MIEADRILEPVAPDAPPIRGLREYTGPSSLNEALRGTLAAIEQTLRLVLRSDRKADEHDRMRAMSAQELPFDALMERLRARNRVSIQLAGMLHELRRRVETGGPDWAPGPVDADRALEVVARLRREVQEIVEEAPVRAAAHETVIEKTLDAPAAEVPRAGPRRVAPALIAIAIALFAVLVVFFTVLREDSMEEGVAAFREGEMTEAVRHFRDVVEDDAENATARLYLGRVYRRLNRHAEAGDQLREAATLAPRDADIRRELGYLFFDLRSYDAAVRQFEQAVELEPAEEANWIGLVRAMRLGGDARAESTLARAPASARALLARENDRQSPEPLE